MNRQINTVIYKSIFVLSHVFALKIFMRKFTLKLKTEAQTYAKNRNKSLNKSKTSNAIPRSHVNLIKLFSPYIPLFLFLPEYIYLATKVVNIYPSAIHHKIHIRLNETHKDFVGLFIYIFSKTYFFYLLSFFCVFLIFWLKHRLYIVYCVPVWC